MAFDPDKYLASKAPASGGFDPDAYLGAKRPLQQIDVNGPQGPAAGMSAFEKFGAGMGKAFVDLGRGVSQRVGMGPTAQQVEETRVLEKPLMQSTAANLGNIAGNVAAAVPATFIPGANTLLGATALSGALGAAQPVGVDESAVKNSAAGMALGAGGYGAGKLLARAVGSSGSKVANIEAKVAEKAAQQAASETASARSAAGNAAQNAYRQLEHLRELGALRNLSPEESKIMQELSLELAQKAQEKLIPAAALKQATAKAYRDAIASESDRAAGFAAEKLSGYEVKRQIAARLMRYGPAAVGGMAGNLLFPGLGGAVGGAATGLVLRPAIRSMVNLSKNPAVQRAVLSPVANATALQNPNLPLALALIGGSRSSPSE